MDGSLEQALTELDGSTVALLDCDLRNNDEFERLVHARTHAIERVAGMLPSVAGNSESLLERLNAALLKGEAINRRALQWRQELLEEWGQQNRVAAAYGCGAELRRTPPPNR